MFAKNKVTQSMLDAVNQVLTEKLDEASLKIPTSTGTKVLGRGYGNSAKAHEVQHKNPFEKGPSKSQLKGIKAPTKKELKSIGEEEEVVEEGIKSKIAALALTTALGAHAGHAKAQTSPDSDTKQSQGSSQKADEPKKPELNPGGPRPGAQWRGIGPKTDAEKEKEKNIKSEEVRGELKVQEELKGGQKKIDANHNNKIDGQDFAILRGKKKVKTEGMEFANKLISTIAERDEGKPGLMFKKIASKAAKKYGSQEAGNRVAGAMRKKVLAKEDISEEQLDEMINEVLSKDASAGDYIHDFIHSKNPKFAGKSTAERKKMALGAYYGAQKEEVELNEDESLDSIAKKHGMEYKKTTYGAGMKHKTKGEISINRYGEWHHYPAGSKSSKAHGSSDNNFASLDKHLSSMKEEVDDYEMNKNKSGAEETAARKSIKAKDTEKSQKIDNLDVKYGTPNSFKCEEVELDEAAPKKMDDVMRGKQNLEPAKKGVVGTVKSDLKNFRNFLTGKKETNEAINPSNQTIDTLAGRSKKVSKAAKMDNDNTSSKVELKAEEVESLEEDRYLEKFLSSRGINPKFVDRNVKVAHAKSNVYKSWLKNHKDMMRTENNEVPFDKPYKTTKEPVNTDKSMERARALATKALKKVKNETMMGKAGATSESKNKW